MTGKDTAASFKGLIIGLLCVAVVVVVTTMLTNKKFEGHDSAPAAAETH